MTNYAPLWALVDIRTSNVDKKSKDGEPAVRLVNYTDVYYSQTISSDMRLMEATASPDHIARFGVQVDDIIITKDSESPDDIGVPSLVVDASDDMVCAYHLSLLRPDPKQGNARYLYWVLESDLAKQHWFTSSFGVTRYSILSGTIARFGVPNYDLQTQQRIADYLDRETGEIDAMLAKMDELTETLEARRAVATEVAIFADGHRGALGHIIDCLPGYAFPSGQFSNDDSDVPLLRGVNVKPFGLDWSETVYWSGSNVSELSEYYVGPTDIVLGMDRPFVSGGTRVVHVPADAPKSLLVQRVLRIRVRKGLGNARYVYHALRAQSFKEYATPEFTGISVPHISEDQVRNFRIPLPSPDEQARIADHLDEVTGKIDQMLAKTAELKFLLIERRSALITDVVTGKKQVHS